MTRMTSSLHAQWNNNKQYVDLGVIVDELGIKIDHVAGDEWIAICPLHDDHSPSFSINTTKFVYNCFSCGGGSLPDLVARLRGIGIDEAIQWLMRGIAEYDEDPARFMERFTKSLMVSVVREEIHYPVFNESVLNPFIKGLHDSDRAQSYLNGRYISPDVAERFKIGYDESAFRANVKFGTYTGEAIILPHFFKSELVGYQQRWIGKDKPDWVPKYTNTGSFPKDVTLWNYDQAIESDSLTIVVESVFTAIYLEAMGFNAVATFGAEVTDQQVRILSNFGRGLVLAFDNDDTGYRATDHLTEALRNSIPIYHSDYVPGHKSDLNDLGPDALLAHLEHKVYPAFLRKMR